jgi:hypothetical protein
MIKFSADTPDWVKDWVSWASSLLLPQWDVKVEMVASLNDDDAPDSSFSPDRWGEVEFSSANLVLTVKYLTSIEDSHAGHVVVLHELCHAFFARMSEAASALISSKIVRQTAWKSYDDADESTVVVLSRCLVELRNAIIARGEIN